jgi:hypothetical protein
VLRGAVAGQLDVRAAVAEALGALDALDGVDGDALPEAVGA